MAKKTFASMKLKTKDEIKTLSEEFNKIEVKQYLPLSEKKKLIADVLAAAASEKGTYSNIELDSYFELYVFIYYTNITFTEKQLEDLDKLYDILYSNGYIDEVVKVVPEEEYNHLFDSIVAESENDIKYKRSLTGAIDKAGVVLPAIFQSTADIVDSFKPEQYAEVLNFARAANGGRDIETNKALEFLNPDNI